MLGGVGVVIYCESILELEICAAFAENDLDSLPGGGAAGGWSNLSSLS